MTSATMPEPAFALAGLPVFYERFEPGHHSLFDAELNDAVVQLALRQGAMRGVCNVSGSATTFAVESENVRESTRAAASGSINRQRQLVCGLSLALFGTPAASLPEIAGFVNRRRLAVYTAEANSALFEAMRRLIAPDLLHYSEYFGPTYASGQFVDGVPHQDLQQTSFADESLDVVLTAEVFEHIPDALKAEREVVRVLRRGGVYCFTVPFLPYHEHDIVLADLDAAGVIRYYAEPQYHGDPVRPAEGVLVYRLFSHADLKQRFAALGCSFTTYRLWSKALGILGDNCFVCVARKR